MRLEELDLLGRRQQWMPTGLAQEELQGVGRRLDDDRLSRGSRLGGALLLDDLDPALLPSSTKRLHLQHVEIERLEHLVRLVLPDGAASLLGCLEQMSHVLAADGLDLSRRHARWSFSSTKEGDVKRVTQPSASGGRRAA